MDGDGELRICLALSSSISTTCEKACLFRYTKYLPIEYGPLMQWLREVFRRVSSMSYGSFLIINFVFLGPFLEMVAIFFMFLSLERDCCRFLRSWSFLHLIIREPYFVSCVAAIVELSTFALLKVFLRAAR